MSEVHLGIRGSFDPGRTWTVALAGHRSSGKTTLAEHLLRTAGVLRRPGRVDEGTCLLDFEADEQRKHRSRRAAHAWLTWGDARIQLADVPGMDDAVGDRLAVLHAVDAVVLVADAARGIEVGGERVLGVARRRGLPCMVVLTKADRCHDLDAAARRVRREVGDGALPIHLPLRDEGGALCGVIDVIAGRSLRFADDESGAWSPEPMAPDAAAARAVALEQVSEAVAATDDALLEAYLEWFELDEASLRAGLRAATRRGALIPVLLASGRGGIGGGALLDAITALLPPAADARWTARDGGGAEVPLEPSGPFAARLVSRHTDAHGAPYAVFRVLSGRPPSGGWIHGGTGARLKVRKAYQLRGPRRSVLQRWGAGAWIAVWGEVPGSVGDAWSADGSLRLDPIPFPEPSEHWVIAPKRTDDGARDKLCEALRVEVAQDPVLRVEPGAWPARVSGVSGSHLGRLVNRLRARTGLVLGAAPAPVRYLETPAGPVRGVEGVHVREGSMGLVEEFGACVVDVEPTGAADGNRCVEALDPERAEALPARYRPAIREGILRGLGRGPRGYPVVGAAVRVVGGAYDMLASEEEHFVRAGEEAVRQALRAAGTALLEPWTALHIRCPQSAVGDVLAAVSGAGGRVSAVQGAAGGGARLEACVPERAWRRLDGQIRSATRGRGTVERTHSHYEPVPRHLQPDPPAPRAEGGSGAPSAGARGPC